MNRLIRGIGAGVGLVLVLLSFAVLAGDGGKRRDGRPTRGRAVTAQMEQEALTFARQHYAELARVLDALRRTRPQQYRVALRELTRTVRQLKALQKRDPRRYELELAVWKASMKVKLLAARLGMGDDPALETELRAAIREQLRARIALQKFLRDRLKQRLEELEENLRRSEANLDREVEQRLKRLKGTVRTARHKLKQRLKGLEESLRRSEANLRREVGRLKRQKEAEHATARQRRRQMRGDASVTGPKRSRQVRPAAEPDGADKNSREER